MNSALRFSGIASHSDMCQALTYFIVPVSIEAAIDESKCQAQAKGHPPGVPLQQFCYMCVLHFASLTSVMVAVDGEHAREDYFLWVTADAVLSIQASFPTSRCRNHPPAAFPGSFLRVPVQVLYRLPPLHTG